MQLKGAYFTTNTSTSAMKCVTRAFHFVLNAHAPRVVRCVFVQVALIMDPVGDAPCNELILYTETTLNILDIDQHDHQA